MDLKKYRSISLLGFVIGIMMLLLLNSCTDNSTNPSNTKPVVTIVSPGKSANIFTDTTIVIHASDDKGITRVELYMTHISTRDTLHVFTQPPYEWRLLMDSLQDSTVYAIYAIAYDADGNKSYSPTIAFYVHKFLPPQNINVGYITKDSLELDWQDKSIYEKEYDVEHSTDGVSFTVLQKLKINSTKTIVRLHMNNSDINYFRLRGIRDSIASPYSKTVEVYYGSGGQNLYAGGVFTTAGGTSASRVAHWDTEHWYAASTGLPNQVLSMYNFGGDLYAGGSFTNHIEKWDGAYWTSVGNGFDGDVFTMTEYHGDLYAGGLFYNSGGNQVSYIARWDGSAWQSVGNGFNGGVYALAVFQDELYATGEFTASGSEPMSHIAKWDGVEWVRLSVGIDHKGFALAVYDSALVVGGELQNAGGYPANYIAQWDGNGWNTVGNGFDGFVYGLQVYNNQLYAGGLFANSGSTVVDHIAKWNGTTWSVLGKNMGIDPGAPSSYVYTFDVYNGGLYAGGNFSHAGKSTSTNVARWTGTAWEEVDGGPSSTVYALSTYTGNSWQWMVLP